jgi:hypothetical protein
MIWIWIWIIMYPCVTWQKTKLFIGFLRWNSIKKNTKMIHSDTLLLTLPTPDLPCVIWCHWHFNFSENSLFPSKKQHKIQKYGSKFCKKCPVTLWLTPSLPLLCFWGHCPLPSINHLRLGSIQYNTIQYNNEKVLLIFQ